MKKVIISIPAYNEEKTLGSVLAEIKQVMSKTKYNWKILIVNDGSKDKTADVAREQGVIVINHPRNLGLAETFRTEMKECLALGADIIVHTDADGQYRANEIPLLLSYIDKGYDFVLGSRFMGEIEYMPFMKKFGNKAFSRVISSITKTKITDGQTGFRAFTKEVAKNIEITSTYTYTQEQIIRAVRQKYKIIEVPAHFDVRGGKTESRLMKGPFDYAIKAGINLIRVYRDYEPLKFFGRIGMTMILISVLLGIYLLFNDIIYGNAQLDKMVPTILLGSVFFLSGLQTILFGFLADMQKK